MNIGCIETLPAPLTPPDCDLRDFAFMPLDVARLRDSDMASEQTPEQNWAAVMLWAASWHQVPAGSIPDSDNWMAKTAGYLARGRIDPHWAEVRAGALRGFVMCSDGRWYHPVVAAKARESWHKKVHHAWRKECDRIRKANKQREANGEAALPLPPEPTGTSVNVPLEIDGIPMEMPNTSDGKLNSANGNPPENPLKGEGQGQGELLKPTIPDGIVVASDAVAPKADPKAASKSRQKPDCPQQQIIALYHEILIMCPTVRQWTDARAKQLRSRWNEEPERQSLDYWRGLFENIRYNCPFLIGQKQSPGKAPFMVDLEWITKQANFVKILEGRFTEGTGKPAAKEWI